jgi:thymidine kinase
MPSNPEFVIYTGPMFGGKTSRMLAALDRAKYQSKNIIAFKPKMDHRYADENIVTHTGHSCEAVCISDGEEIFAYAKNADIIAVDEAFMIDDVADVLVRLFKSGKTIYVSTIQLSAQGFFFAEVQTMMPWATKVEVCPAVCSQCEKDAYYTVAKIDGLGHIEVGGAETYEPRCHEHTPFLLEE